MYVFRNKTMQIITKVDNDGYLAQVINDRDLEHLFAWGSTETEAKFELKNVIESNVSIMKADMQKMNHLLPLLSV